MRMKYCSPLIFVCSIMIVIAIVIINIIMIIINNVENGEQLTMNTEEMKAQEVVDKVLNHVKVELMILIMILITIIAIVSFCWYIICCNSKTYKPSDI